MPERDGTSHQQSAHPPAGETLLRSLRDHGVEYAFGNFGTDHTPILEAAARLREEEPSSLPEFVTCPHETVALAAAHGYAAATGAPQAVIVHVDVGTFNVGSMLHNAHRGDAPMLIVAGLAPVSHGEYPGSRDSWVHYFQDVYDQEGIVREFCRWSREYRPPADPDEYVARALQLAQTPRRGPTYLSATREALETPAETSLGSRNVTSVGPSPPDEATVDRLAAVVADAEAPLVVTSKLGAREPESSVAALVDFAENAGAGVVEARPSALCFPRSHELHAGFSAGPVFELADLVILADTDVPWVPNREGTPAADVPVVQIDVDPAKPAYPQWDLRVGDVVQANPAGTLAAVADRLDPDDGADSRATWRAANDTRADRRVEILAEHRDEGRLTSTVLADSLQAIVDDSTAVVNEATTNIPTILSHLPLDRPGSYFHSHGSGLGWAPGAAIGVKLGRPESRVISLVGDGSYLFGQPTATAWVSSAYDAPTLTVIFNNSGWNAVRGATLREHPDGNAAGVDVPESKFAPTFDLSHAAHVVDAYTDVVESIDRLDDALMESVAAADAGKPAVLDVRIEPI